jgi:hypothetical protein
MLVVVQAMMVVIQFDKQQQVGQSFLSALLLVMLPTRMMMW